jgi:hypothetical protein
MRIRRRGCTSNYWRSDVKKNIIMTMIVLLVGVAFLYGMPMGTLWAVNTLFGVTIPYTIKTWAAVMVLFMFFGRGQ